jgi:hypothetical protein
MSPISTLRHCTCFIAFALSERTVTCHRLISRTRLVRTRCRRVLMNPTQPMLWFFSLAHTNGDINSHALELEYDYAALECALSVLPGPGGFVHEPLFSTTVEGGFSRHFRLYDQAFLELVRLEAHPAAPPPTVDVTPAPAPTNAVRVRPSVEAHRSRHFALLAATRRTTGAAPRALAGPAPAIVDADAKDAPPAADEDGVCVVIVCL